MRYIKLFENFLQNQGKSEKLHVSDIVDQIHDLPETSLNNGQALDTIISLLPQLELSEARKFVQTHLYEDPISFCIPRPGGKDIYVKISKEMYDKLVSEYLK
jgi:hypothetical protein